MKSALLFAASILASASGALAQSLPEGIAADELKLWLRSDAQVVLQSGQRVNSWGDLSGNEHTCVTLGPQAGPLAVIDDERSAFGLPAIAFDRSEENFSWGLRGKGLAMRVPGPYTLAMLVRPGDEGPRGIFSLAGEDVGRTDFAAPELFTITHGNVGGEGSDFALRFVQGHGTPSHISLTLPCEKDQPVAVIVTRNDAGEAEGYVNGKKVAHTVALESIEGLSQNSGYLIGDRWPQQQGRFLSKMDMFELMVFNRALSEAEVETLSRYLTTNRE